MSVSSGSNAHLNIPNFITLIRILLTPLFIIFLIQERYHLALWVFLFAGISDVIDGIIARRWHQKTPLGTFLDPLADKLLMGSSFVTLSIFSLMPSWLTVVVISRDVVMVLGILVFKLWNFPLIFKPSVFGKMSTTFQVSTVLMVLVVKAWNLSPNFLIPLFWLTGVVTAISGIHYVLYALRGATQSQNQEG